MESEIRSGGSGRRLLPDLLGSMGQHEYWLFSTWLAIVSKYRRSSLGILWLFTPPIAYMYGIGYFYSSLLGKDPLPYQVHLGIGYLLWRMITQVFNQSSSAMNAHRAFIFDGRVRFTDYLMQALANALFYQCVALLVLLPLLFMAPDVQPGGFLWLFVSLPVFYLNLIWLSAVLGVLGARFPDLHELSATIFVFGFLLTPIVWRAELMPADSTRGFYARFNPAFHLLEMVRAPLLGEPVETTTIWYVAIMTVVGSTAAVLLYRRYSRYIAIWI